MTTALAKSEENWEWTPEKEQCLELFLKGVSKLQIAKTLGVHRNTVNNWCSNPAFVAEASDRVAEHKLNSDLKHTRVADVLTDTAAKNAIRSAAALDKDPDSEVARRRFREFSQEWRDLVRAEREVLGLNVQRIEQRTVGVVRVEKSVSFKGALTEAVKKGVIDAEAISKGTTLDAVRAGVHALLSEGDGALLTEIHEADEKAAEKKR